MRRNYFQAKKTENFSKRLIVELPTKFKAPVSLLVFILALMMIQRVTFVDLMMLAVCNSLFEIAVENLSGVVLIPISFIILR